MKKLLGLVFCTVLFSLSLSAQRTVSGSIIDDTGLPMIGANVLVDGTDLGTITDIDGSFSLVVPDDATELVVSYTGYSTQTVNINGLNSISVTLSEGELLDEIVVTGLGIKKEKKALGYGVSTIDVAELENRSESDVSRLLRGKTTGVDITSTSGLAGSGTSIVIRGYSSISGTNQPLFVVDGVPFNTETNTEEDFVRGGASASSRFLDLDPNNIKEINILKGLSATVLYGEAGRNGVVLITTKTGDLDVSNNKGMEVSFNQKISWNQVANLPEYQNTYGNGFSGNFGWFFSNWGPSFDTRGTNGISEDGTVAHPFSTNGNAADHPSQTFDRYEYRPYESVEDFFQTGIGTNTSLSVSKSIGENSMVSASYSVLNENGFTPKLADGSSSNNYKRNNFALGMATKLDNGIRLNGTFNYVFADRITPPIGTSDGSGPTFDSDPSLFADVLYTPRSIDLFGLPFQSEIDNTQTYYRQGASQITHPLWTLNNAKDTEDLDRFFGNINLGYDLTDNLSLNYRISLDKYSQQNDRLLNRGGQQFLDGSLTTSTYLSSIVDNLLTLNYDFQLNEDLNLSGVVGGNGRREDFSTELVESLNQFVYGLATHDNFISTTAQSRIREENTLGLFGTATVGFRNFLYVGVMARNDWTSTLEDDNRSVFYPSINASFIPTEAIDGLINNKNINYLKLRASIGQSAGYPNPYGTRNKLFSSTRLFVDRDGTVLNNNAIDNRLGNPALQAEKHREVEAGIEGRFWQNKLGVDLSAYNKRSSDLIIDLDLDPASGFSVTRTNAAEVENKGLELGAWIEPLQKDFRWRFGVNFTMNENTVVSVSDDVDQVPIAGFSNLGNFAIPGEPFGVIQGTRFERLDGQLRVTDQGFYQATDEIFPIGDPNPDYTVAYLNTLGWKGLNLFVNLGYTKGGDIYSGTASTLLARGNTIDTEFDRFLPFVLQGVDAEGNKNDIQIYAGDAFFEGFFGPDEGAIFDGTVLRLREVSLGYTIPKSIIDKTPFGSLSLSVIGENLWYNAFNFPEGINFDPEVLSVGVGNGRGMDFITGPTAKRYGVSLSATF